MEKNHRLQIVIAALVFCALCIASSSAQGQVSWYRQAYGQLHYVPGHEGDPGYAFNYPNNNNWSQQLTFQFDNSNPPKPLYETAPSNWSTNDYPNGSVDVTLGNGGLGANNAPTNLDRGVKNGTHNGEISINSLTIQADGGLNLEFGTGLIANLFNFQGNNSADATLTIGGGGGAFPVLTLPAGGTIKKTTGTSTFMLDSGIVLLVLNGGTIAADSGALQLSGNGSAYAGGINFNAATGALIDLAPANAVDSGTVRITGAFTGINTGGTVRLNKGWIATVGGSGGATFNFGGNTLQWQGGSIRSTLADPFINAGTINITGGPDLGGQGFTNQGTITQSGAGLLNMPAGTGLTNAASGVFDIRNDSGLTSNGGGGAFPFFINKGTLKKSAGTGNSKIEDFVLIDNIGGTIKVDIGTLTLGNGLVTDGGPGNGGTLQVATGATLQLNDGTSDAFYNGTYTGSGGGTVLLGGGGLGPIRFMAGATFNFPGTMFQWTGGTIGSNGSNPFTNAGNIQIGGPVGVAGIGFTNQGTITQGGAGTLNSGYGSGMTAIATGIYDIKNDLGVTSNGGGGAGPFWNNAGTFRKSGGTGTSIIDTSFTNSGTITAGSGTLQFTSLIQTAGLMDLNGGNISSPNDIALNGGSLVGTGTISGNLRNNSGTIAPGHSPGKITISGNYFQGANGTLSMEIGGPATGAGYDQLVVDGGAALGGTLNLTAISGSPPTKGDVYTLISASSFSGQFSQVNISGFSGNVDYSSNGVTITVTSATTPVILNSTTVTARTGQAFRFQVLTAGGSAAERLSTSALPPGLTADPVSGIISGTPASDATFNVVLTITQDSVTTSATLRLIFTSDPGIPVIISPYTATVTPGQNFIYKIEAPAITSADDVTKFSITGTLPAGLQFDAATGTISGTLLNTKAERAGSSESRSLSGGALLATIQMSATNSHGTGTAPLTFFTPPPSRALNISTRLAVGTDQNVLIGGFIVTGNAPKLVIVRAIGPSLSSNGVAGVLADPFLELRSGGNVIATNDNWRSNQEADIIATTVPPSNDLEPAIVAVLQPGPYTAIVRGSDGGTGIGLVEAYDLGTASMDVGSTAQLANISTRGFVSTADNVLIGGFIAANGAGKFLLRAIGPSLTGAGVSGALQDPTLELRDANGQLLAQNDNWKTDQEQAIRATTIPPSDDRESALLRTLAPGNYTAIVRGKNNTTGVGLIEVYNVQ